MESNLNSTASVGEETLTTATATKASLRELIFGVVSGYLKNLSDNELENIENIKVYAEVEAAMYGAVMERMGGNQTKAALFLGISRGNLRAKLQLHYGHTQVGKPQMYAMFRRLHKAPV